MSISVFVGVATVTTQFLYAGNIVPPGVVAVNR